MLLERLRDVIEFPVEGLIDAGGWDLRKALKLAHGGNAVVNEWVRSPLAYEEVEGFRRELAALVSEITNPVDVANHYRGLAQSQKTALGNLAEPVKVKKVLYLVRPILALFWMREHNFAVLPPMDIESLRVGCALPEEFSDKLDDLLAMKKVTRELGVRPLNPSFVSHLERLLAEVGTFTSPLPAGKRDRMAIAQEFYARCVLRFDTGA